MGREGATFCDWDMLPASKGSALTLWPAELPHLPCPSSYPVRKFRDNSRGHLPAPRANQLFLLVLPSPHINRQPSCCLSLLSLLHPQRMPLTPQGRGVL